MDEQDIDKAEHGGTVLRARDPAPADPRVRNDRPEDGKPDDATPERGSQRGNNDGSGGAERRRYKRSRVLWGATLRLVTDGSTLSVTLANVSASGAKLMFSSMPGREEAEVIARLQPKLRVVLLLPDTAAIPAEVVWVGRGTVGINFLVDPHEASRRLGRVARLEQGGGAQEKEG